MWHSVETYRHYRIEAEAQQPPPPQQKKFIDYKLVIPRFVSECLKEV